MDVRNLSTLILLILWQYRSIAALSTEIISLIIYCRPLQTVALELMTAGSCPDPYSFFIRSLVRTFP